MVSKRLTELASLVTIANNNSLFHIYDAAESLPVNQNKKITYSDLLTNLNSDLSSGSPLTTKGDLYTYDTADARLPVGTDGQLLSANSATATGLEWITVASGGDPDDLVFESTRSANFTVADSDHGKQIPVDNTITITLPDSTVLSKNVEFNVDLDVSSEIITYSASGSATISSSSTTQSVQYTTVNCRFNRSINTWILRGGLT